MSNTVYRGILKTWKDDRGFGFIQPDNGDKDIFVHISSLKGMARRPNRGDVLFYEVSTDNGGKLKAVNARIEGVEIIAKTGGPINWRRWLWLLAFLLSAAAIYFFSTGIKIFT